MDIKYDEYELLELFCNEPISIAEKEAGEFIYSFEDGKGFKLVMLMDVYRNECNLTLTFKELIGFTCKINEVESINKINDDMVIKDKSKNILKVKFKEQVGIELL
ncbi:hypothetical protein [Clostridium manihotivorum]|uniref:Uncharacterized protein n=1 Tax=Clostridium manihotivorum TaxID=2320868 RepID=A0A3R5VAX8_9CLOT|nr:hypothetical protein [Clostridium manihotivorum]QAA34157.1 hypothetical protein C1I91_22385 [Clostridium manihotivorum]